MIAQNDVIVTSFLIHNILCNCNTDYTFKTSYRFPRTNLLESRSSRFRFAFIQPSFSAFGQALDRLVTVSSTRYRASTSALSTLYSSRDLTSLWKGYLILRGASRLDAFSVYPFRTWLLCHAVGRQQIHQWSVHPGPLVLRTAPLKYPTPTPDRDRTVSRRSEPSSRTALMGGQPNPWNRIQLQDAMSRHRGAKPRRRCELLGEISLLSPG